MIEMNAAINYFGEINYQSFVVFSSIFQTSIAMKPSAWIRISYDS